MKKIYWVILFIIYYYVSNYIGFGIPCLFHEITNLYCPGCGITRMFFSLLNLEFYQAFRYNPLVFILLVLYLLYKLLSFKLVIKLPKSTSYVVLGIVVVYGILRNLDMFNYLKPTIL